MPGWSNTAVVQLQRLVAVLVLDVRFNRMERFYANHVSAYQGDSWAVQAMPLTLLAAM
jgi:hypothetical protein